LETEEDHHGCDQADRPSELNPAASGSATYSTTDSKSVSHVTAISVTPSRNAMIGANAKTSAPHAVSLGSKETFAALITNGRCRTKTSGQNMWDKYGGFWRGQERVMTISTILREEVGKQIEISNLER